MPAVTNGAKTLARPVALPESVFVVGIELVLAALACLAVALLKSAGGFTAAWYLLHAVTAFAAVGALGALCLLASGPPGVVNGAAVAAAVHAASATVAFVWLYAAAFGVLTLAMLNDAALAGPSADAAHAWLFGALFAPAYAYRESVWVVQLQLVLALAFLVVLACGALALLVVVRGAVASAQASAQAGAPLRGLDAGLALRQHCFVLGVLADSSCRLLRQACNDRHACPFDQRDFPFAAESQAVFEVVAWQFGLFLCDAIAARSLAQLGGLAGAGAQAQPHLQRTRTRRALVALAGARVAQLVLLAGFLFVYVIGELETAQAYLGWVWAAAAAATVASDAARARQGSAGARVARGAGDAGDAGDAPRDAAPMLAFLEAEDDGGARGLRRDQLPRQRRLNAPRWALAAAQSKKKA